MSLGRRATIGAGWVVAWRGVSRLLGVANTIIRAAAAVRAERYTSLSAFERCVAHAAAVLMATQERG
jgi:hypothetical protein